MSEEFMREALKEAQKAFDQREVPIGAVLVKDGKIVGRGYNLRESSRNALAHAEIVAIHDACSFLGGWRLTDCTLYVTIEPCPMCAGAILQSRIKKVVIGSMDPKAGACGSLVNLLQDERFNHQTEISVGMLSSECSSLMKNFFKELRKK